MTITSNSSSGALENELHLSIIQVEPKTCQPRFRLCSSLVEQFPVEVLSQLLRPLLSPAYRCTTAFRGYSLPDVVSLDQALALTPAQRRSFLANLAQSLIDSTSDKLTAAGRAADFAQALNGIRKAVEQRRQQRVQKRRLQPVTDPEAAAATRRAKNRRRAEGPGDGFGV